MILQSILQKRYPQGSYGGQCATWLHSLVDFPSVGNSLWQKKAFVSQSGDCITYSNLYGEYRIGDILFTSESLVFGHVALIVDIQGNNLVLAESNFKYNLRVSYGRLISKTSSKIIGIGRFPLRFSLNIEYPIHLKVSAFLNNYQKKWNFKSFEEMRLWFELNSGGKLTVDFYPLYTSFGNWWYTAYGSDGVRFYNVINKGYFEDQVMPLRYPDVHAVALAITNKEWQGSIFNSQDKEIAWYHPHTNPAQIQIACDETDVSPWYFGKQLYQHALEHELLHFLNYINGKEDNTHKWDNINTRAMEKAFLELNFDRIYLNL